MSKENNTKPLKQPAVMCRYPLATKTGVEMLFAMLLHDGAMCPKCGERVARNGT